MKFARVFALAAFLMAAMPRLAAGSDPAPSVQALLLDDDCEAAPELLGDWAASGDLSGTWSLQNLGGRSYRLVGSPEESDPQIRPAFDICVAHLGGALFFDATYQELKPDGKEVRGEGNDAFYLWIPIHLIGRLEIEKNALHFRLLDDDWLQDALKSGRVRVTATQNDNGDYFLTASPKELKEFASLIAADPRAFSREINFTRVSAKPENK